MTPAVLLLPLVTAAFLVAERVAPGRALPQSPGWYARALAINGVQLGISVLTGRLWPAVLGDGSILELHDLGMPALEGFIAWFVGTFVFYWWHRLRHRHGWWEVFHQVHHSPSRIEAMTSFYKHPIEIFTDTAVSAVVAFALLGCSFGGFVWFNVFAATGEYVYHSNIRTPRWLRYFVQTPELHSIHHQYDLHWFNFGDLPLWDRLFGTYRDATEFVPRCGFPGKAEERLGDMLAFRDVYDRST